ncbi:MAG: 4a-hydroxytetrahydrobiopterin dehydratase [Candidatus Dormibacteria bacterium]
MALRAERCEACSARTPTLTPDQIRDLLGELDIAWAVNGAGHLQRDVDVDDFATALALAVRCGMVAESEGHHPDLTVSWGRLRIEVWTHAVGALTRADMVLAAHLDAVIG